MIALVILLAVSAAGNAYQYHEHGKDVAAAAVATSAYQGAKDAGKTCTDSVDKLAADGKVRQRTLIDALARIAPAVKADQEAALKALQAKPDDPKDLCASLGRYLAAEILKDRGGR